MQQRNHTTRLLRDNLLQAQNRMKQYADKKRSDRQFQVGDEVYLKLQPYRQSSLALRKNLKLSARFYGPYKVIRKIGLVAYELQLPPTSKIHPIFHVSLLKRKIGTKVIPTLHPPELGADGQPHVYPVKVLDKRMVKRNNVAVTQLLIQWSNLGTESATWEDFSILQSQFPDFDPWGQGSTAARGNVMAMVGEDRGRRRLRVGKNESREERKNEREVNRCDEGDK